MQVDPEGVYLEIQTHATIWNFTEHKERRGCSVVMHFKDGGKWRRMNFIGRDDDTMESLLSRIGTWVDQHGLAGAIDQAMGRDPEAAANG